MNDRGTKVGLWVSAFEVLFHPGAKREVNKRIVQAHLATAPWQAQAMMRQRYKVKYNKQLHPATLPERVYDALYKTRNRFMHGNPIRQSDLLWSYGKRRAPLEFVSAALFGAALRSALRARPRNANADSDEYFFGISRIEDALRLMKTH